MYFRTSYRFQALTSGRHLLDAVWEVPIAQFPIWALVMVMYEGCETIYHVFSIHFSHIIVLAETNRLADQLWQIESAQKGQFSISRTKHYSGGNTRPVHIWISALAHVVEGKGLITVNQYRENCKLEPCVSGSKLDSWFCCWWRQFSCTCWERASQSGARKRWGRHRTPRVPPRYSTPLWPWYHDLNPVSPWPSCPLSIWQRTWQSTTWLHLTFRQTSYQFTKDMSPGIGKVKAFTCFICRITEATLLSYQKQFFQFSGKHL